MEITLIPDTITTIATNYTHTLGSSFSNFPNSDQNHQISAVMFPIDAIAPPVAKPRTSAPPKTLARKRCRVKRSSKIDNGGGGEYADEYDGGFFDGGDGPFGGGGGGGGDGFNWDESVSPSDPAFDFVYGVLCWIVFSNCLHFAFKKVIRILTDSPSDRDKVPIC
uniref:uncharacterized protein LOC122610974 n=1 Tax=Erigeron canadensis TaxID=72917 RepID=UPI001CB8FAF4|nr:uncharacterized protein LOC122610974 [Erigeron canadensis]